MKLELVVECLGSDEVILPVKNEITVKTLLALATDLAQHFKIPLEDVNFRFSEPVNLNDLAYPPDDPSQSKI